MARVHRRTARLTLLAIALLWGVSGVLFTPNRLAPTAASGGQDSALAPLPISVPPLLAAKIRTACADCHATHTTWPWYAVVPPFNFVLASHVRRGRREFLLPTWAGIAASATDSGRRPWMNLGASCYDVKHGIMPPRSYRVLHPESRWSPAEVDAFCTWAERLRDSLKAAK